MSFESLQLSTIANPDQDNYTWSVQEERMLRYMLEQDGLQFFRYFFKIREGAKLLLNWHHLVVEYTLQAVLDNKINRLIINIPPGYTKTEQAVLNFIARGLALNMRSKFIHASYSASLADANSAKIRDTIETQEFQDLWPMKLRADTRGKKRWFTESGGGMMAVSSEGQITGFRAGRMEEGFTGAFVIDDPVKPDDAYSKVKRSKINNRFNNTMRSRLALETVPMIVIMQRIHDDDLTGFLLRGGSGDKWHHLKLPANLTEEVINKPKPAKETHSIPVDINVVLGNIRDGLKWGEKHAVQ